MNDSKWQARFDFAVALQDRLDRMVPGKDDWDAIDTWLAHVRDVNQQSRGETAQSYRTHLAKVRWYCEKKLNKLPSEWTVDDVHAFQQFLTHLPASAICAGNDDDAHKTPFRRQPSPNSLMQIMRFTKAMFKALNDGGFFQRNPAYRIKLRSSPTLVQDRTVPADLFKHVLDVIEKTVCSRPKDVRAKLRDRFVFLCFRECGMRMSEMLAAKMNNVHRIEDGSPTEGYWALTVTAENSLNNKARIMALSPELTDAFFAYRQAFGLSRFPVENQVQYGLVLSTRSTMNTATGDSKLEDSAALPPHLIWLSVGTKSGLTTILNGRLREAANILRSSGDADNATLIERVSSSWLRHTFAMDKLGRRHNPRSVAEKLGYAAPGTIAQYIDPKTNAYVIYESELRNSMRQQDSKVIDPWDVV